MKSIHPMRFGACLKVDGNARFALWAPQAQCVELLLHETLGGPEAVNSERCNGGWYEVRSVVAQAGQRYQWRIDGGLVIPDPASRFNPAGPHEPSELIDPSGFVWNDGGWTGRPWHELVFYQMHVGSFTPQGTYVAAADHLPRLARLGVTALQLMPLADFPGRHGWGYDGVLPFAPFHGYGRPEELKSFIQSAHRRGLAVLADVVYNHFGPDGNFLDRYAPQFFSKRHHTAWGAAINMADDENGAATVREFFIANALYWVDEYRFDGLRLDAAHAIVDGRSPGFLHELSTRVRAHVGNARHVHLVLENDDNQAERLGTPGTPGLYDGQWNGDVHHALHVALTGERSGYYAAFDAPVAQLGHALTRGFVHHVMRPASSDMDAPHERVPFEGQAPLGALVNMLQTHDQIGNRAFGERLLALSEPSGVRLAAAIVLLAPSVPLLFMGEEWGSTTPFLYFCDWEGELAQAVRTGRDNEFAATHGTDAQPSGALPDACDIASLISSRLDQTASDDDDGRAWWALHAELLACRAGSLVPWLPDLQDWGHTATHAGALLDVRWAFTGDRTLHMRVNLSAESATCEVITAADVGVLLHRSGHVDGASFGPWSGEWRWKA